MYLINLSNSALVLTHQFKVAIVAIYYLQAKFLHSGTSYPFLNHHPVALTVPFAFPIPAIMCCTRATTLVELLLTLTLWVSEEAKGSLDLCSTHGLNCSGCVAAACLANASALPLKGHVLWSY